MGLNTCGVFPVAARNSLIRPPLTCDHTLAGTRKNRVFTCLCVKGLASDCRGMLHLKNRKFREHPFLLPA
jgi:hypothetical protein